MPVVERTNDRLRIRSICLGRIGALATFDRVHQTAEIVWLATVIPFRRRSIPLADLAGAQVRKREDLSGKTFYGLTLRRRRGDDIRFSCSSREDAMSLMQTLSDFLAPQ